MDVGSGRDTEKGARGVCGMCGVGGHCCSTNPELKRGRRLQLLQMLALPFVPILALITQNAFTLRDIVTNRHEVTEVDRQVYNIFNNIIIRFFFLKILLFMYSKKNLIE
jgi:hypothetical protein